MLNKNDELILHIDAFGTGLSGIGRHEGMAVFVPGAIKDETVRVRIIKKTAKYAVGKLLEVLKASPARIAPPCPIYEKCGGCTLQHIDYAYQLQMKAEYIADCFRRNAGISIAPPRIHGMAEPFRYRNKAQFPCGTTGSGPRFGLYELRSHSLIPVDDCLLADERCKALMAAALEWMEKYSIEPYDESSGRGTVRHLIVRTAGGCLAMLAVRDKPSHLDEFVSAMRAAGADSVAINHNPGRTNLILGDRTEMLYGGVLKANLCGLDFNISPESFFQVNSLQAEKLYSIARDWATDGGRRISGTFYDIYCGTGTIGLIMADYFDRVVGIEINPHAVADARKNAASLGIGNAVFHEGAAEQLLPKAGPDAAAAVLDPPRRGCDPALLSAAASLSPERLIYISCNPATLARDAGILASYGYTIKKIEAVDMFPQTEHVESVVLLSKANK